MRCSARGVRVCVFLHASHKLSSLLSVGCWHQIQNIKIFKFKSLLWTRLKFILKLWKKKLNYCLYLSASLQAAHQKRMLGVFVQFCVSDAAEHNDYLLQLVFSAFTDWDFKLEHKSSAKCVKVMDDIGLF